MLVTLPARSVMATDLQPDADVARVVRRVVEEVSPLRVILFGSRANGTASPESDIDLLVVVPNEESPRAVMRQLYERIGWMGVSVDYIPATLDQIDRYRDSVGFIYREALRHGVEVYNADTVHA